MIFPGPSPVVFPDMKAIPGKGINSGMAKNWPVYVPSEAWMPPPILFPLLIPCSLLFPPQNTLVNRYGNIGVF